MIDLKQRECAPLPEGAKPLSPREISDYKALLLTDWTVEGTEKISRYFVFENFKRAMAFVQEIAAIAEKEQHHPDICINYSKVRIELSTHDVGGLSENDFIMAAKIEAL